MNAPSHLNAPISVPYRYIVRAVAPVAAVTLDSTRPIDLPPRRSHQDKAEQQKSVQGRYNADSAAPAFAAHILVEAGLTGSDPFAGMWATKAYDTRRVPPASIRLVA
jgi:hypothetical protein